MKIEGFWIDSNSSKKHEATLEIKQESFIIHLSNNVIENKVSKLKIEDRLGDTLRTIILPDESIFLTQHNEQIDELFPKKSILFYIESNFKIIPVFLVLIFCSIYIFYQYILPTTVKVISNNFPQKFTELISKKSFDYLDNNVLYASKISQIKQEEIRKVFNKITLKLENKTNYQLYFRDFKIDNKSIANALALPNGDIIITDELIKLSNNNEEINSILLHELGHIEYKHGLQNIINSTIISFIIVYIAGDINFLGDLGITFGTFLLQNSYSRDFEIEADVFAFESMIDARIDPIHFSNILERITPSESNNFEEMYQYLSTHPLTKDRIDLAHKYHNCFLQNIECN